MEFYGILENIGIPPSPPFGRGGFGAGVKVYLLMLISNPPPGGFGGAAVD
jgi:hypothetical protein